MEMFPTSSSPPRPASNPSNPLGFHLLIGPFLNAFRDQRLPPLVLQFPLGTTLDETTSCQIDAVCTNLHNFSLADDGEGNQRVRLVSSIHSLSSGSGSGMTGVGTVSGAVGRVVVRTLGSTGSIGSTGAGSIGSIGSNGIAVAVGSMRSAIRAASGGGGGGESVSAAGSGSGSDTGLNNPNRKYAVLQGLQFPAVGDWLVRLSVWRQGVRVAEVEAGLVTVLEREVWETLPERVRTLSKFRMLRVGEDIL